MPKSITTENKKWERSVFFVFFFVSGFSSLVYQVVWTRLAFASFGIITPVFSVVISVFMLGLSIGSWAGGRFIVPLAKKTGLSGGMFYAATEFIIGLSAYAVPRLFAQGERVLLSFGASNSFSYLFLSAVVLAISILPWCLFMGATFPFMMAYIRERSEGGTDSFSYLYVANVLGAMCGTFLTAIVFVELFGFRTTLQLAAMGNFGIALSSGFLAYRNRRLGTIRIPDEAPAPATVSGNSGGGVIKWILFATGFSSMAMEVVWTRQFTHVLTTQVYSFALIVGVYLGATLVGSMCYRRHLKKGRVWKTPGLIAVLTASALLPILAADPRVVTIDWGYTIMFSKAAVVLASIVPICAVLGYLTPGLIDQFSQGNPATAGRAYAINVLGCILGPLVASYALLPFMSECKAVIILSLPFLAFYLFFWKSLPVRQRVHSAATVGLLAIYSVGFSRGFADGLPRELPVVERRDYAASVISAQLHGTKMLLVNSVGMTSLTPITKFMVHLPLMYHNGPPQSVLVICFGMGTSYRSALSWDVDTTAVELIPDVPKAFGYYHADAAEVLKNPKGHIVIDDGRRFLNRTQEKYDVVVVDPPPPVEAAGSSLLYSTGFYDDVKRHLKPNGILQMWLPGGDLATQQGVAYSICKSFPYRVSFPSVEGWGMHYLASMEPIEQQPVEQLVSRMPSGARKDLLEWAPGEDLSAYVGKVVRNGVPTERLLDPKLGFEITDDDPVNEYFLMRRMGLF